MRPPRHRPPHRSRRPRPPLLCALLAGLALTGAARPARAQRAQVSASTDEIHAGVPFVLTVSAEGFDESPRPTVDSFAIPGCRITALDAVPSVSSSITIINGRRSESRQVVWGFRFRIEAGKPGTYRLPALTVRQGQRRTATQPVSFEVGDIGTSHDMQLRLLLPERPVWVGEAFTATLEWYLRRDPQDQSFAVPLFERSDWFSVRAPPAAPNARTLRFAAGASEIELPYTQDTTPLDGAEYHRFRFSALVTPNRAGTLDIEAPRVVARLQVGMGRDPFGFRVASARLFKAEGRPARLEVRPLPLAGRPPSFSNAVGKGFSIQVQASRTVVRAGDPVELAVKIRGDGDMQGLGLPPLGGAHALPAEQFTIVEDAAAGTLTDDGKGKQFTVTVRLRNTQVREIPPLPFSYFDPETGTYQTVRSEPIALSVQGSALVGAGDVVSGGAAPAPAPASGTPAGGTAAPAAPASLVGADLSLSAAGDTMRTVLDLGQALPLLAALYGLPLLLLGVQLWRLRHRGARVHKDHLRSHRQAFDEALAAARTAPARDAAPRIAAALRALARAVGELIPAGERALIDTLETQGFDPRGADRPLDEALVSRARSLADTWLARAEAAAAPARRGRPHPGAGTGAAALLLLAGVGAVAGMARATAGPGAAGELDAALSAARTTYTRALGSTEPAGRSQLFARAQRLFAALAAQYPDRPELLTDLGNAALGAQELGHATLAYRRALLRDPGLARARRNLAWVRRQAPSWLPQPEEDRALDSLFFWHRLTTVPQRHLIAGIAFAALLLALALLTAPGAAPRRAQLRPLAAVPLLVWLTMIGSIALQPDASRDAVVVADGATLRAADTAGAPAALPNPLPPGAELAIVERRDGWIRVALASGATGWLPDSVLAPVLAGS
jgi:hypothetical protein